MRKRSRHGIYLEISKHISSTVYLVLNPDTGNISPQYHVVFDDTFSTVFSDGKFTESIPRGPFHRRRCWLLGAEWNLEYES